MVCMTESPYAYDNYNLAQSTASHFLLGYEGKVALRDLQLGNDPLDSVAAVGDEKVRACEWRDHGMDSKDTDSAALWKK